MTMKNVFSLLSLTMLLTTASQAQMNIGANAAPNADAMLELSGSNKGLLLPRVALSSTSSTTPLNTHVAGMTVYNTASAGSGSTAVSPGCYYNTGSAWVKTGNFWNLGGNFNGSIQTLGTNDNIDLPFVTNNTERMRITGNGKVGIGTVVPNASLSVLSYTSGLNFGEVQSYTGASGTDPVLQLTCSSGTWRRLGTNNGNLAIFTNNTELTGSSPQFRRFNS